MVKLKGLRLTFLVIMVAMCACALVAPASAQPTPSTPFMIYGYVYYENGTVCNGPVVNITNQDTGNNWSADTNAGSNYYQRMLANGTDVNASEILQFEVTSPDGSQSKTIDHTITQGEINNGGLFNFNVTLVVPNPQVWYLTSVDKPTGGVQVASDGLNHAVDNLMHKGEWAGTGESFYLNHTYPAAWFYADTGAECDLGFGEYSWTAYIRTEKIGPHEKGTHLKVSVCKLDSGGNVIILAEGSKELTKDGDYPLWEIDCLDNESTTQNFITGDWLAVRLCWTDAPLEPKELQIYFKNETGSDSYIKSPITDPGYPVPELPTIILFSTGLLALAGYVWLTKRRR